MLAVLDPGAQTVGGPRNSAFEGLPKGAINITFDGINAQCNLLKSSDGFFSINDPRIDDIEEFGITTSGNRDPSKTGQGAVQMAYVSKRGGNAFHGGVWEYNRNTDFDSNYYFNNAQGLPRQTLQLNDFGYKVGGPIFKDKLFFFTDFDFFQFPQAVTRSRTLLTPLAASGVFSYTPVNSAGTPTMPTTAQLAGAPNANCSTASGAPLCTINLYNNAVSNGFTSAAYSQGNSYICAGLPNCATGTAFSGGKGVLAVVEGAATAPGVTVSSALVSPYQESIGYNSTTMGTRRYPDIRLDYNLTKHHSLEFDYHYAHYASTPDLLNNVDAIFPVAPFNTSAGAQISNRNLFVLAERWTIGSNKSNEIRFGIQSAPVNFGLGVNDNFWPTTSTNFNTAGGLPYDFGLSGVTTPFLGLGSTQGRNASVGELHETFGWTHGSHQFSFGGDATDILYNDFIGFNAAASFGLSAGDPLIADAAVFSSSAAGSTVTTATFPGISSTQLGNAEGLYGTLIGDVTGFSSTVGFNPTTRAYQANFPTVDKVGQFVMGVYAGDAWRIRPNVTFNYGLRWEYDGPSWDKYNEYYILPTNDLFGISGPGNLFAPGSTAGTNNEFVTSDAGKSWVNRYFKAFAPSVGLAYQPNWDSGIMHRILGAPGKTVLRAGFSIAYSNEGLDSFFGVSQTNPGLQGAQSTSPTAANSAGVALPNNPATGQYQAGTLFIQPNGSLLQSGLTGSPAISTMVQNPATHANTFSVNGLTATQTAAYDPNYKPPMTESWNAGIQRELSQNMVLEIRYQANHGVGLTGLFNLNEVNIFENGFLSEFQNAQANLNLCNANAGANGACVVAEKDLGLIAQTSTTTTPVQDFADLFAAATAACGGTTGTTTTSATASCATSISGLSADHTLPIFTAALNTWTGPITPAQLLAAETAASSSAGQLAKGFSATTEITDLGLGGAGSLAGTLGSGSAAFSAAGGQNNMVLAGYPSNFFVVNPQSTGGTFAYTNAYQSTYNALIVDLRHRPSHGMQFDVAYTFSKSLTNYQANSAINNVSFTTLRDIGYDKGPSPFNAYQTLKLQFVYQLPFGAGHRMSSSNGFMNRIIGGWEVDSITRFQTGQPVLVTSGVTGGSTFNTAGPGINLVGLTRQQIQSMLTTNKTEFAGAVAYVPASLLSGTSSASGATANTSVFQPCNVAGTLCSKPFFNGPSFFRADISLVKTTKITERVNFEMRMEALNAFNDQDFYWAGAVGTSPQTVSTQSTRFGLMGSNNTNGAYSDINTTQDPGGRIIQLVGRINF